jgi:hypothetical protein
MGFPFMMWGGGGGSEMTSNGQTQGNDLPAGSAAGAAAGAGAGALGQEGLSEDEQIYGRQPETGIREEDKPEYDQGGDAGWVENEEIMQDPWGRGDGQEGGLFGGSGGASGDTGGSWGDFGDWS